MPMSPFAAIGLPGGAVRPGWLQRCRGSLGRPWRRFRPMDAKQSVPRTHTPWYRDWVLVPLIGIVYVLDQLTKHWVESSLCPHRSIPDDGPIQLTCSFNTGTAFGLFPGQTFILVLASIVGLGVLLFVYRHHPVPGPLLRISLGLQLGGAIGNLTDRLRFGQVTDFVHIGSWPVFNLADASIVVGVVILVWLFVLSGDRSRQKPTEAVPDAEVAAGKGTEAVQGDGIQEQQAPGEQAPQEQHEL